MTNLSKTNAQDSLGARFLDGFPYPHVISTADGQILTVNSAFEEWTQKSRSRLKRQGLEYVFQGMGELMGLMEKAASESRIFVEDERKFRFTSGQVRRAAVTIYPESGEVGILIIPHHDKPSGDTWLGSGDTMASLGRMLAHEIKNPLAGIKGAVQLMSDELHSDESQELAELIKTEVARIRRLVEKMESYGDISADTTQPVNIHDVLHQACLLAQSASETDLSFDEDYDTTLPSVPGDRDALMQAFLNLIINATEAIKPKNGDGHITIRTHYRPGVIRKTGADGQGRALPIEISIIDNGPGISEKVRPTLFQPFVTDKPAGQGLGLPLVARIVELHNGIIEVDSHAGMTRFSILLPQFEQG